jgi:hypothetical protein
LFLGRAIMCAEGDDTRRLHLRSDAAMPMRVPASLCRRAAREISEVIGFLCFFAVEIAPFGDRAGARRA